MRHSNPDGDLAVVVERAVDLLLAKLEKQRLGRAARPAAAPPRRATRTGYVSRAVRREVFTRDGERCSFVDASGRRCESRAFLELDHGEPRAMGGPDDASNLSVRCRAHNLLAAERAFGRAHIERCKAEQKKRNEIHPRQRGYEEPPQVVFQTLCTMGFRPREARHALETARRGHVGGEPAPVESLLREALAVLA